MRAKHMTLREAISGGRLREFAAQEEARGVGPASRKAFDAVVAGAIKSPKSKGRTSRSSSRPGSAGK
jgi:hypothetical protein